MADENPSKNLIPVLLVGDSQSLKGYCSSIASLCTFSEIASEVSALVNDVSPPPEIILCKFPSDSIDPAEVAQLLSAQYVGAFLGFVGGHDSKIDRKSLIKNGFSDVFFMPTDRAVLTQSLTERVAKLTKDGKSYRSIKLFDVDPGVSLDFDTYLYLPSNKRYLHYTQAGDEISKDRAVQLKAHQIGSLFIGSNDMDKFYGYTAKRLKALQSNSELSETERAERLASSVRELFGSIFTESTSTVGSGKSMALEGEKIVKKFILAGADEDWYRRVLAIAAQSTDAYSHAGNTSTYAALFALGLGLKTVEELAIAGLLHDIGLERVLAKDLAAGSDVSSDEARANYESHPNYSIEILLEKKMVLSDLVKKIILQHHERFNGSGYPKRLRGDKICVEAQILGVADRFDEITVLEPGKPRVAPEQAIKMIYNEQKKIPDPQNAFFDPRLLDRIIALFP